jgi:hypothetical protein
MDEQQAKVTRPASVGTGINRSPTTVVVLQTHYLSRALLRMFRNLVADVPNYAPCVLMHLPPGKPKPSNLANIPHHFVTTPEIRDPAYSRKSNGPGWGIWRGGHTDLIALHFFRTHPNYERYWFIEYDVRFSGAWRGFFAAFENSDADFVSTSIRRASNDPRWMHWPTLHPATSVGSLPANERLCSFMPIFRVSRRAFEVIDRAYREGWTGHCEASWPTILYRAGCKLEDFGGDGEFVRPENRNRFYTNTLSDEDLAPGSLVFRPVRWVPGFRRNRLWHPVKPLRHKLREDARHVWVLLKPYLPWVRHAPNEPSLSTLPVWPEEATRGPSRPSS